MESYTDLQLRCFNPHTQRMAGKGERGKKNTGVCVCLCVSAHRFDSPSAEPNVPLIKVYLDQVVTGFSGREGRLV